MKRIIYLLTVLPLFFLASCNNDEFGVPDKPATSGGDIEFNIGFAPQMQTRVATDAQFKSTFEDGDAIGIFAVKRASGDTKALATTGNYMHNVKLTYNKTDDKWTGEAYYTNDGKVLDFYAYYPYDATATDPINITFNVLADQSTASNYSKSDLLSATPVKGIAKGTAVDLTFAHKLALVQVEVDPGAMKGSGPSENLAITLRNCLSGGAFNLGDGTLSTAGDAVAVKMLRVEQPTDANYGEKYTYRALVPVQTVASGTSLCLMAQNGQLFNTPKLAAELSLTAGAARLYTAKLPVTALQTVKIAKGTFLMGSSDGSNIGNGNGSGLNTTPAEPNRIDSETQHSVTLTKDFYMSKYQITNAQYAAFLNAKSIGTNGIGSVTYYEDSFINTVTKPHEFIADNSMGLKWETDKWVLSTSGYDNHPIIDVTWYGAVAYCAWLSEQTGGTWSLPTEAEWEYACRAGTTTIYSYGDEVNGDYMWYSGNNTTIGETSGTKEVGRKRHNAWGLYDMHGNVWEWCSDWHGSYGDTAATDPTGSATADSRLLRGGSWLYGAQFCRSALRTGSIPGGRYGYVGFRVVFVP